MPSPNDYRIRVSAGTDYDPATHIPVCVNDAAPLHLRGPGGDVWLNVRIKNFRPFQGEGDADKRDDDQLSTSPYFDTPPHKQNDDTYGIGVWFVPCSDGGGDAEGGSGAGIPGADLQWGNDFDEPIRDRLPPGFGAALRIVKWWIDPGLEGDPYADKPYMYGPALSSFNRVYAALGGERSGTTSEGGEKRRSERSEDKKEEGERSEDQKEAVPTQDGCGLWFGEGGDEAGRAWRAEIGCPELKEAEDGGHDSDGKARMKWALAAEAKAQWKWQYGRGYGLDFYNGFLDFTDLALRLPGFHMPLLRYWDGQQSLRYVLRHRQTGAVYLVVVFHLVKVGGDNNEKREEGEGHQGKEEDVDESKMFEEARRKWSTPGDDGPDISADDVD